MIKMAMIEAIMQKAQKAAHISKTERITDYVNANLSMEQRTAFEAEMVQDEELRRQVQFEQELKQVLKEPTGSEHILPEFSDIRERLQPRRKGFLVWPGLAWPPQLVLACTLAAICLLWALWNPQAQQAEYKTLTDAPRQGERQILRLVGTNNAALEHLIQEYKLTVLQRYPNAVAIDVAFNKEKNKQSLPDRLADDERVKLVEPVGLE